MHRMGCRPILCVFHTVTIDRMLTEKRCVINNGLKNATCKHYLKIEGEFNKSVSTNAILNRCAISRLTFLLVMHDVKSIFSMILFVFVIHNTYVVTNCNYSPNFVFVCRDKNPELHVLSPSH